MGSFGRSWDLLSQSFSILKSDKELMLLPVLSAMFCLFASAMILGGGALFLLPVGSLHLTGADSNGHIPQPVYFVMFFLYLVNYFVVIFFNVALVSAASEQLAGRKGTLNGGLQIAWERKGKILQWALLAATVGVLLRALERRLGRLGLYGGRLLGIAWSLATYFVIPVIAAENVGPGGALTRSAQLFKDNWGERVAGGFSFGLIFFLLMIPGVIPIALAARNGPEWLIPAVALAVVYWLLLSVMNSALYGIFQAALYRYATTKTDSLGFDTKDLAGAWKVKG
jgi:hypothetical protein